ncbi:MAG: hypothetical protein J0H08_17765 [Rhizobiales bacterium]|nr:hypothetical protein [Hyphomicrobiales bacterium]
MSGIGSPPPDRALQIAGAAAILDSPFAKSTTETQADLDSGDRIDLVHKCLERTIVLVVKSKSSEDVDLRCGGQVYEIPGGPQGDGH